MPRDSKPREYSFESPIARGSKLNLNKLGGPKPDSELRKTCLVSIPGVPKEAS